MKKKQKLLLHRLDSCPGGNSGWRQFEDVCIDILKELFVPPLRPPQIQSRTLHGTNRRDAIFPNRNHGKENNWAVLLVDHNARMLVFDFKNYTSKELDKEDVTQVKEYLTDTTGKLGIIVSNTKAGRSALIKRNDVFGSDQKVILFFTREELKEMINIKMRGEDPSDLIMDTIEAFYSSYQ